MYNYYELYKNSKGPIAFRVNIVIDAKKIGMKPADKKIKDQPQNCKETGKTFSLSGKTTRIS